VTKKKGCQGPKIFILFIFDQIAKFGLALLLTIVNPKPYLIKLGNKETQDHVSILQSPYQIAFIFTGIFFHQKMKLKINLEKMK